MRIYLVFTLLLLTSGCATTSLTQIESFAESTESLTDATNQVIDEYNHAVVTQHLQLLKYQHHAPINGVNAPTLTVKTLAEIENVFGSDAKKKLAIYRANKAINDYAKAIKALAQAGQRQDISKATVEMVGSLEEMETSIAMLIGDSYQPYLDEKKLGVIGATIDLIGSEIAEKKRRNALKRIITDANPVIKQLIDIIIAQLDSLGYEAELSTYSLGSLSFAITDYNNRVARGEYTTKPEQQFNDLQALWKQTQAHIVTSKKFAHLKKSLKAIATEHNKIAKEVENDTFTSKEIVSAVQALRSKKKRFEDFQEAIITCDKVGFDESDDPICEDDDQS